MRSVLVLLVFALHPLPLIPAPCEDRTPFSHVLLLLDHGDVAAAERGIPTLTKSDAECPQALLIQARIAAANGDNERAADLFARYEQTYPDDPQGYAYHARFLIDEEDYAGADALAAIAIEKGPRNAVALAVSGQLLGMKGDRNKAIDLLGDAATLNPEDEETQFQLGSVYDRAKLPGEAMKHFRIAATLNPKNAQAWDYLALQLEPLGDVVGAASAYKQGLLVNRDGPQFDSFLDYNYGRFLMKLDDLAASRSHLDRAVQLVPDMRAPWYERARLELRQKDYQAARKDAETAANLLDPQGLILDLQLYALLASVYHHLGKTELASKYAQLGRDTPPPVRGERH